MGIENRVRRKKGDRYWERHKGEILARASSKGNLMVATATYGNSRERRRLRRLRDQVVKLVSEGKLSVVGPQEELSDEAILQLEPEVRRILTPRRFGLF